MIPVSFSVYFGFYVKTQMSSFLETFNEHPKQFILVYLGGFRERNNYTLKTFFINTLLTLLILKY